VIPSAPTGRVILAGGTLAAWQRLQKDAPADVKKDVSTVLRGYEQEGAIAEPSDAQAQAAFQKIDDAPSLTAAWVHVSDFFATRCPAPTASSTTLK